MARARGVPGAIAPAMKWRELQPVTGASLATRKSDFEHLSGLGVMAPAPWSSRPG